MVTSVESSHTRLSDPRLDRRGDGGGVLGHIGSLLG